MKRMIAITTCKAGGAYRSPGTAFDVNDDDALHLLATGSAAFAADENAGAEPDAGMLSIDEPPVVPGEPINEPEEVQEPTREEAIEELSQIEGVTAAIAEGLYDAGYLGIVDVQNASTSDLTKVRGIGEKLAKVIRADARAFEVE